MLRYYLNIDPDKLTDMEWTETYANLNEIRKEEGKAIF